MDSGKATDGKEDVAAVEEDVVSILIDPTTPGKLLTSNIFLGISEVPIGMLFRETVDHMLVVNTAVEIMVVDTVTTAHVGCVAMEEDGRFQKLILIGLTPAVEDVVVKDAVHIMALNLERGVIDS